MCMLLMPALRARAQAISDRWFLGMLLAGLGVLAYLCLLLCLLCNACRSATKAHRRRKQNEFELETLKEAEREAGGGRDDQI